MPKIPWLTSQGYRAHAPLKLSTADLPKFGKRPAGSGTLAKTAPRRRGDAPLLPLAHRDLSYRADALGR
jgi:hypothetical protein